MTVIAFRRFGGEVPRVHPRLLSAVNAQKAVNTKLWNGKLRAYRRPKTEFQTVKPGPIRSIYKYRGGGKEGWLHWNREVDVVKAPIAGDEFGRIYITGDGRPKLADSTTVIAYTARLAEGVAAGANQITVASDRGFEVGDECIIDYGAGVKQTVTLLGVTPNGATLVLTLNAFTISMLTTSNSVVNSSHRFPLVTYDLGVPAPAQKLSLQVLSGGVDGEDGVLKGDILAISDAVLKDVQHTDTSTIGAVQSGNAPWTMAKHNPFHAETAQTDGSPLRIEASCRFTTRIRFGLSSEVRDVGISLVRDPADSNVEIAFRSKHLARPSAGNITGEGGEFDPTDSTWTYVLDVNAVDVPTPGTYTYRMSWSPVAGIAGSNNDGWEVTARWRFRILYSTRIKLTLAPGHGLVVGDTITLSVTKTPETAVDRDLDGKVVKVLAVDGDDITIEAPHGGVYNPGGTWRKSYSTDQTSDRAYVYTYVASFNGQDFEGPPSPPSSLVTVALSGAVRLSGFVDPTNPLLWNTQFSAIRIYRLNAGETLRAEYLFLAQVPLDTAQYDDSAPGETLNEVLPTSGWELPPEDLRGIIELPEGGAAAFTKKEFCMAEPYFLHAWPASHRRTTHDEIVAIGAFGTSIGIATKGTPYIVTGLDPATVSMERIELVQPCLSASGSVDLGYAFVYPSPDGLVSLSPGRAEVVTKDLFTEDEWRELNPASFVAARYGDRYLCFYEKAGGERGGFILDPRDPVASLVFLDFWASEVWADPQTGRTYIVQDGTIREFDADSIELEYRWKSKEVALASPVSMGFACVEAARYPLKITVFADRQPLYTRMVVSREPFRLPGRSFGAWAVEVEGVHEVEGIYLAETAEDLTLYQGGE